MSAEADRGVNMEKRIIREISDRAVRAFRERIAENRVNLHGFLVIQGNRVAAEHYYEPFGPDSLHRMFL